MKRENRLGMRKELRKEKMFWKELMFMSEEADSSPGFCLNSCVPLGKSLNASESSSLQLSSENKMICLIGLQR